MQMPTISSAILTSARCKRGYSRDHRDPISKPGDPPKQGETVALFLEAKEDAAVGTEHYAVLMFDVSGRLVPLRCGPARDHMTGLHAAAGLGRYIDVPRCLPGQKPENKDPIGEVWEILPFKGNLTEVSGADLAARFHPHFELPDAPENTGQHERVVVRVKRVA